KEQFVIDADTITLGFTVSIPATHNQSSDLLGPRASRRKRTAGVPAFGGNSQLILALRAHCGRDAGGPSKSLDRHALLRQLASSKIQRNFNSERAAKPND